MIPIFKKYIFLPRAAGREIRKKVFGYITF